MREWVRVCAIGAVAGCLHRPSAHAPVASTPLQPTLIAAVVAPCITPPDEDGGITDAAATGSRIEYCIGASTTACFSLDLERGGLDRLPARPTAIPVDGARAETVDAVLKICSGTDCTTITPKVLPSASRLRAATTTNGSFAAILIGDASAGKGHAEVWDVTKKTRVASFKYAHGDFRCGEVAMLGTTVYVSASQCGQPAARATLYTLRGKKLGDVGGKDYGMYGNAFVHLGGTRWAFLEESGAVIAIQDVATGKLVKTIPLVPLWALAGAQLGNPGESALLALPDGKLAVVAGAPATGSVATVDSETGAVATFPAPHCAPVASATL